MIVFEINSVSYGSTGRIMFQIADAVNEYGGTCYTASSYTKYRGEKYPKTYYRIGSCFDKLLHILLARFTGKHGCYSRIATHLLIKKIKAVCPDVIHLHNLHGWFLNIPMLFDFLKTSKIPIVWTLHDCWSFTGHCPHFISIPCFKWQEGCYQCPMYRKYPQSYVDDSSFQYELKKKCFTGIDNLTIVTPSKWLAQLVSESYLKENRIIVINNGINTKLFKPTAGNFRKKNNLSDKRIILGVAFDWGMKKGLQTFIKLSSELPHDYVIVLVGVDDELSRTLPKNIIIVKKTQDQNELADIYSSADIFVNPTEEDVFPLVNIEALAAGTPVITYDAGGAGESISPLCGKKINVGDYFSLKKGILDLINKKSEMSSNCVDCAQKYKKELIYKQYIELYKSLINN